VCASSLDSGTIAQRVALIGGLLIKLWFVWKVDYLQEKEEQPGIGGRQGSAGQGSEQVM